MGRLLLMKIPIFLLLFWKDGMDLASKSPGGSKECNKFNSASGHKNS